MRISHLVSEYFKAEHCLIFEREKGRMEGGGGDKGARISHLVSEYFKAEH